MTPHNPTNVKSSKLNKPNSNINQNGTKNSQTSFTSEKGFKSNQSNRNLDGN